MSEYSASAPVVDRNTVPMTAMPAALCGLNRNFTPYTGLSAASTDQSPERFTAPTTARNVNHTSTTEPNTRPMLSVPRDCTENSTTMMTTVIISVRLPFSLNSASNGGSVFRPSTAELIDTAGVSTESARNAAFALVVDTHGDEHVFDGGDQRYRPEHQRQHAEHGLTVGVGDAALTGKERLRGVQGRCSDVAVDHAERDDGHAERDLVGAGLQSAPPAADRSLACGLGEFFRFLGFCRLLLCKLFALLFRQCATGDFRDVGERVGT